MTTNSTKQILVLGGTGKSGRRVADRLTALGYPVRIGTRSDQPAFDWDDQASWAPVLKDVDAVYVTYYPDLAFPGAAESIRAFSALAVQHGVRRLVLLSGRGEPEAEPSERGVQDSGAEWTVLRASWFSQNFSEHFLLEPVLSGEIVLPSGDVTEPFIDVEDVADVAVAALTEDGHHGKVYELTGPRLLTFAEAAAEISRASGREVKYLPVTPEQFSSAAQAQGVPIEQVAELTDLFTRILDGRNSSLADGVPQVLGRPARDFTDYVTKAAATGIWRG